MPTGAPKVLVLGELAGARHGDHWFAPNDVASLFEALRVPAPGNINQELSRLRKAGFVRTRSTRPSWTLTPEGADRVKALVGDIDLAALAAEIETVGGARLGHAIHTVLPPALAPVKWAAPIQRMLTEFDFDRNVFCMTRFPRNEADTEYLDPVAEVIPAARQALKPHGLVLHVASDRLLDDDLYGNIAAHMWACRFGVALFEDRLGRGLNHNMIIEVGSMLITGRRCALLKDHTIRSVADRPDAETMPTDFVGQIYKPVDFDDLNEISSELHRWAAFDLGLGPCASCPASPAG